MGLTRELERDSRKYLDIFTSAQHIEVNTPAYHNKGIITLEILQPSCSKHRVFFLLSSQLTLEVYS